MAAINPGNVLYNDASGNPVAVAAATPLPVTSVATAGSAVIGKVGTDQTTPGTTDRVTTGDMVNISATFTRPANTTAYASGQLVANNVTAGSVTPMAFLLVSRYTGGAFRISRVRLNKSSGRRLYNTSYGKRYNTPTSAEVVILEKDTEGEKSPKDLASYWSLQIELQQNANKDYIKDGRRIVKRYKPKRTAFLSATACAGSISCFRIPKSCDPPCTARPQSPTFAAVRGSGSRPQGPRLISLNAR
jgi:hypothetical protein